jgi:hypothetical protein
MTFVHPIITPQDHVVAGIMDFWVIRFSWGDVDVFERPIETWRLFGAVHPDYPVLGGSTGKVGEVDIGPSGNQLCR